MPPKSKRKKSAPVSTHACSCTGAAAVVSADALGGQVFYLQREVNDSGNCRVIATDGGERCWSLKDTYCAASEDQQPEYAQRQRLAAILSGRADSADGVRVEEADSNLTLVHENGSGSSKGKKGKGKGRGSSDANAMEFVPDTSADAAKVCGGILTTVASELASLRA